MQALEQAIKELMIENYGSVNKFAKAVNLPSSTVYNALDRGMANTRTELTDKIYRKLNVDWDTARLNDFSCLKTKQDYSDNEISSLISNYKCLKPEFQSFIRKSITELLQIQSS